MSLMMAKMPNKDIECYLAVQGEGKTIGKPMIFVRLSGCNLTCNFCDTFYTWNFDDIKRENKHLYADKVKREDYVVEKTVDEVFDYIINIGLPAINLTGGEPSLQQIETTKLIEKLRESNPNFYVETETNGTVYLTEKYINLLDQINCSPKLGSSGNLPHRTNKRVIQQLKNSKKAIFKFVIMDTKDIEEIKMWQKENDIPNSMIFLMPEGITRQGIMKGTRYLMDMFAIEGYNISTRLQILIYGNKRAV